jgi:hypothetical protein
LIFFIRCKTKAASGPLLFRAVNTLESYNLVFGVHSATADIGKTSTRSASA